MHELRILPSPSSLTHARTHALTHSLTHARTHALTHSLTHPCSLSNCPLCSNVCVCVCVCVQHELMMPATSEDGQRKEITAFTLTLLESTGW
jgi:hypothetical protein